MRTDIKESGFNMHCLYPCPKCELTAGLLQTIVGADPIETKYSMECLRCGFKGPKKSTPEEAWEAWWKEGRHEE